MQAWTEDPVTLVTELDAIRNAWHNLGPTLMRKVYAVVLVPLGVLEMAVFLQFGALLGCLAVWIGTQLSSIVPTQRESLESFRDCAQRVSGTIVDHREVQEPMMQYFVTIRYTIAPNSSGGVVEKELEISKDLYVEYSSRQNKRIEVLVLPDHPRSGYPLDKLTTDLSNSWSMMHRQVVCIVSIAVYLIWSWVLLVDADLWETEDIVWFGLIVSMGPLMIMPQAHVLHRVRYRKWITETLEKGTILEDENKPSRAEV
jgi:hypothetical protein